MTTHRNWHIHFDPSSLDARFDWIATHPDYETSLSAASPSELRAEIDELEDNWSDHERAGRIACVRDIEGEE